ncbi:MAG: transporter substrate-binding domain-containing protein [Pseudomonadota bacterium]
MMHVTHRLQGRRAARAPLWRRIQARLAAVIAATYLATPGLAQTGPPDCVLAALYPPFMIADTPRNAGLAIDMIREAAARAGRRIEVQFLPFQRTMLTLKTQKNCIMPALFRNPSREGEFSWIATYDSAQMHLLTVGASDQDAVDTRTLRSIAVETGASADEYLTTAGYANLTRLSAPESSARMLHAGRVAAWVQTRSVAKSMWKKLRLDPPVKVGATLYSVPVFFAAHPDFPSDVAAAYRAAIDEMLRDGTVDAILAKYD